MRNAKRVVALLLSITLLFSLTTTAFATEPEYSDAGKRISYSELPEGYKSVISPDAIIYQQEDGSYDIYQDSPVLEPQIQRSQTRSVTRYAPNGGSYSDLENGWLSLLTCVVYQTYLPRDVVDEWISEQVPDMKDYILGLAISLGSSALEYIANQVLATYGYHISVAAIVYIIQGTIYTINWLNFNQVNTASNSGQNGILIEYLTTIGGGNARVYSSWSDEPYVPYYPYGGNATWHDGDYYVMP